MSLAPFNQEVARRLVVLDQAIANGGALSMAFASAMAGQPDRVNISVKQSSGTVSFAFAIDVANKIAAICELFDDAAMAELIRAETAKAPV